MKVKKKAGQSKKSPQVEILDWQRFCSELGACSFVALRLLLLKATSGRFYREHHRWPIPDCDVGRMSWQSVCRLPSGGFSFSGFDT
jgi:hypothetical protein